MTEDEIKDFEKKAAASRLERVSEARELIEDLKAYIDEQLDGVDKLLPEGSDTARVAAVLRTAASNLLGSTSSYIAALASKAEVQNPMQPNPVLPVPQAV